MQHNQTRNALVLGFIFISAIFFSGVMVERSASQPLQIGFFCLFLSYLGLAGLKNMSISIVFTIGLVSRILLFVSLPNLSDDFYRFFWDGSLSANNIDPYLSKPSELVNSELSFISKEIYKNLNSSEYFTIYPPSNQFIYKYAYLIGQTPLGFVNVIRTLMMVFEILAIWVVYKLSKKNAQIMTLFFLNPLLILEGIGNIHFEIIVNSFILLATILYLKRRFAFSGVMYGLAIATKLLPLIYLPFLFLKSLTKKKVWFIISSIFILILTFAPWLVKEQEGVVNSLELYFKKFEFNASIYYLVREVGYWVKGYNIIGSAGPWLASISTFLILLFSIIATIKKQAIFESLLWILMIYLSFTTTVHPWYIIPIVTYSILSGYFFGIIWSYTILWTYIGYGNEPFSLPSLIVFGEYFLVFGLAMIELWRNYVQKKPRLLATSSTGI